MFGVLLILVAGLSLFAFKKIKQIEHNVALAQRAAEDAKDEAERAEDKADQAIMMLLVRQP
jgi:outer membrane murein-binding lipoprotein Lpp